MTLNDSTRRALRTAYQYLLAAGLGLPPLLALIPDSLLKENAGVATLIGGLLAVLLVVVKVLNTLEDRGVIPAWLKSPASDGANPKPDNLPVAEPDKPADHLEIPDAVEPVPDQPQDPPVEDVPAVVPGDAEDLSKP